MPTPSAPDVVHPDGTGPDRVRSLAIAFARNEIARKRTDGVATSWNDHFTLAYRCVSDAAPGSEALANALHDLEVLIKGWTADLARRRTIAPTGPITAETLPEVTA